MPLVTQAEHLFHGSGCTLVLPGILLASSALLLAYRGATEGHEDLPLNGFLANILLQMMPLVALKVKIWSCSDRVSLVPIVLCKTLLMHVALGVLRIASQAVQNFSMGKLQLAVDCGAVAAALAVLHYEFEFTLNPMRWLEHRDVRNLVFLAGIAAFMSEAFWVWVQPAWMTDASRLSGQQSIDLSKVLFTAANYVDIVGFMPVVWRLFQADNEHEDHAHGTSVSSKAKRQVRVFFLFVGAFYMWDDVIDPVMNLLDEPLAMMAHAAHFMLLLDFAGFFTFQVAQPANVKNVDPESREQLQGLLSRDEDDHY